jgi:hypothetical protein
LPAPHIRNYNEYTLYREFEHFASDVDEKFDKIEADIAEMKELVKSNSEKLNSLVRKDAIIIDGKKGVLELKKVAIIGGLPSAGGIITLVIQKLFFNS